MLLISLHLIIAFNHFDWEKFIWAVTLQVGFLLS